MRSQGVSNVSAFKTTKRIAYVMPLKFKCRKHNIPLKIEKNQQNKTFVTLLFNT